MDLKSILPQTTLGGGLEGVVHKAISISNIHSLGERQQMVFNHLNDVFPNGATAKELSVSMFNQHLVPSPERNSVHPRLNELIILGVIYVIGKKTCEYTTRSVTVYKCK